MKRVGTEQASARRWDAIIVGSSFAAMFYAAGLRRAAGRKLDILIVERGGYATHAEQIRDPGLRAYDTFSQDNQSGAPKEWVASSIFGGNSNCWSACIPRFHPTDFKRRSLRGVERDWPIGYDELEPYYCDVEDAMDAAGGGSDHLFPRSRAYPFPAHAPSRADVALRAHDPLMWIAQAAARSNGGRRATCCANAMCAFCPVDSKYTIINGLAVLDPDDGLSYLLDHECRAVLIEGGRATGVVVRGAEGERELRADLISLGANAISNAAILLRSGLTNPLIGRGIGEQLSQVLRFNIDFPNFFGGTHITGNGYAFYDGDFLAERASVLIEVRNDLDVARVERGKWLNNLRLKLIAADPYNPENRVVLADDEPHVVWTGHSAQAHAGLKHARDNISSILPFAHTLEWAGELSATEAHLEGGTPMAANADEGVVDDRCAVFGVAGLQVVGAGVFTTCSAANPTLTLAAIALRAGEKAA